MNTNTTLRRFAAPLAAVLALTAAAAAHADDITPDNTATQVWASTKTRAQVQQELFAARADGSIRVWSTTYNPLTVGKSVLTRDEVKAQLKAERTLAPAARFDGEDSGSFYLAQQSAPRASGPVLAQASR